MNNKLEVIGIDHGWSMMKTVSQVFVTGVKEITTMKSLYVLMELYKVDANTILGINKREDCKSIDTRLAKMEKEKRAYFTASFLFMLENAEEIV